MTRGPLHNAGDGSAVSDPEAVRLTRAELNTPTSKEPTRGVGEEDFSAARDLSLAACRSDLATPGNGGGPTSAEPCVPITLGSGDFSQDFGCQSDHHGVFIWMGAPPAEGEMLAPCPFCGCDYPSTEKVAGLEVCNTHTPSYWIACNACGAEKHDNEFVAPEPLTLNDGQKADSEEAFVLARAAAVAAWNTRDERWRTRPAPPAAGTTDFVVGNESSAQEPEAANVRSEKS